MPLAQPPKVHAPGFDDWMWRLWKVTGSVPVTSIPWSTPGTIGSTTPNTGKFTTLESTGNTILGNASTDTLNVGDGGIIKDASGNVGIGVTPAVPLHIKSSLGGYGIIRLEHPTDTGEASIGYRDSSDSDGTSWVVGKNIGRTDDAFSWYFGGERAVLSSAGDLGIGRAPSTYKLEVEGGTIGKGGALGHHVDAYGAVGDGSTDDVAAIESAINAAKVGTNGSNLVVFGAKNYRVASKIDVSLEDDESVEIRGVAPNTGSGVASGTSITLDTASNNVIALHVYGSSATGTATLNQATFVIRDLRIYSDPTSPGTGQIGLQIGDSGELIGPYVKSIVDNVLCAGFTGVGIKVLNTRRLHFNKCSVFTLGDTGGGIGCYIIADGAGYSTGDIVIDGCEFTSGGAAGNTERAIKIEATGSGAICSGIHITNSIAYFGEVGIEIYANTSATVSDVFLANVQVDGFQSSGDADADLDYGLYIHTDTSACTVQTIHVANSYFFSYNLHGVYVLSGGGSSTLASLAFTGCTVQWNDSHGMKLSGVNGFSITGCSFNHNGTTATEGGDAHIYVSACQYFVISGNSGYSPSGVTNAYIVDLAADYSDNFSVVNNSCRAGYASYRDQSTGANKTFSANYN